jgi:hypothetical protein
MAFKPSPNCAPFKIVGLISGRKRDVAYEPVFKLLQGQSFPISRFMGIAGVVVYSVGQIASR